MGFGARLKEERRRLGFKQAEFAALVGSDEPKQSLYENDHRKLRADYLARVGSVGVDLLYVLTGVRGEGALDAETSAFMTDHLGLPHDLREAVKRFVARLREADRERH